jgi:tetratricopeptide (TPR) repeat protein
MLATVLGFQGACDEAVDCARHALRLSPSDRSVGLYASLGLANAHFTAGNYAEASTSARIAMENGPGHIGPHVLLTASLVLQGEMTAAVEARDALLRVRPEFSWTWIKENIPVPVTGERGERFREAFRTAGIPEA